jgi:hypothetical protein
MGAEVSVVVDIAGLLSSEQAAKETRAMEARQQRIRFFMP